MLTYATTRRQHRSRSDAAPGPLFADRPIYPSLFSTPTTPFLIDSPKRLKIAATLRKQSSRLISNRIKTDPSQNAFTRTSLSRLAAHFSIFPRPFFIPAPFLIDSPKRLKIAATPRKQSSRLISNRIKTDPFQNAFTRIPLSQRAPQPSLFTPFAPSPLTRIPHPHKLAYRRGA
jgi:hypothetical protein